MIRIELTPRDMRWLEEQYPILPDSEIRKHLRIGNYRLAKIVKDNGWVKIRHTRSKAIFHNPKPKKVLWLDEEAPGGRCIDCRNYVKGCCIKTGKDVGALWQKKCFKGEVNPPHSQKPLINHTMEKKTKVCSKCGRELPVEQFGRHARTKDGLQPNCRECRSKSRKAALNKKDKDEEKNDPREIFQETLETLTNEVVEELQKKRPEMEAADAMEKIVGEAAYCEFVRMRNLEDSLIDFFRLRR